MILQEAHMKWGDMLFYTTDEKADKYKTEFESNTWEQALNNEIIYGNYDCFIDVGAGFGYYSMMAAYHHDHRQIYSIEPHPIRYGLMAWNMRRIHKARLLNASVGVPSYMDPDNPVDMCYPAGSNYIHDTGVPVISLSSLLLPNTETLIKIDVEGAELAILRDFVDRDRAKYFKNWVAFIVEYHRDWKHVNTGVQEIQNILPDWTVKEVGTRSHVLAWHPLRTRKYKETLL